MGLPRDSVANVSQVVAVDQQQLLERVGLITAGASSSSSSWGIDVVLGRV